MSFRYEIRLSGEGGQGLVLAGKILAEAAAIYDEKNATQSQTYGPEARGGASRSEIIISDEEIDYPKAIHIDLLLAFTQEACSKYHQDLKDDGILLTDSDYVKDIPAGKFTVYQLPIIEIARSQVGKAIVANIVALGIIAAMVNVITVESIEKAILSRVPKGTESLNLKAFKIGLETGKNLMIQ